MEIKIGRVLAGILALALLLGAVGLYTQSVRADLTLVLVELSDNPGDPNFFGTAFDGVGEADDRGKWAAVPTVLLDVDDGMTGPTLTGANLSDFFTVGDTDIRGRLFDSVNLSGGTNFDDKFNDKWIQIMTGPLAGQSGSIDDHREADGRIEIHPMAGENLSFQRSDALAAIPMFDFDGDGVSAFPGGGGPAADDQFDDEAAAVGVVYRILEGRPRNVVELELSGSDATFSIRVENTGAGFDTDALTAAQWPLTDVPRVAGVTQLLKIDLAPRGTVRVLSMEALATSAGAGDGSTVVDANRGGAATGEPDDYWIGRLITWGGPDGLLSTTADNEKRLITDFANVTGTFTVAPGFTGAVAAGDQYALQIIEVPAFDGDSVRFRSGALGSRTVVVDNLPPIILNVLPADAAVLADGLVTFSADIIDVGSEFEPDVVDMQNNELLFGQPEDGFIMLRLFSDSRLPSDVQSDDITWTKIDGGWRLSVTFDLGSDTTTESWGFQIIARDRAGNHKIDDVERQDANSEEDRLTIDGENPQGVPSRKINALSNLNPHIMLSSRTGDNWAGGASPGERWRMGLSAAVDLDPGDGGGAPVGGVPRPGSLGENNCDEDNELDDDFGGGCFETESADRRGVLIVFNEPGGLDAGTVDPSDFLVNGLTPVAVIVVDVIEDSQSGPNSQERKAQEVFLTMAADLPSDGKQANGDKIVANLVGVVRDVAGNPASFAPTDLELEDGIPPKLTVTTDKTLTKDTLTVTVVTDETLNANPTISIQAQTGVDGSLGGAIVSPFLTTIAANTYEVVIDIGSASTVPAVNQAAKLNVQVTAGDVRGNEGTTGATNALAAGAIALEVDPELNNSLDPEFVAAGTQVLSGASPDITGTEPLFITVDFGQECTGAGCSAGGEAAEYPGDTHQTVTLTSVAVQVVLADTSTVTPAFTLSTTDGIVHSISIGDPPIGDYTVTLTAQDDAGNVSKIVGSTVPQELAATFTVTAVVNTPPVAVDDAYALAEGGTLTVDAASGVLANDTDAEVGPLTALFLSGADNGTLTLNPDGSFTYIHDGSETTSDSFTYAACDPSSACDSATVILAIAPVNNAPVAADQSVSTPQDTAKVITLTGSDSEGSALTFSIVSGPANGSLDAITSTGPASATVTYTPNASFTDSDSFTFKANDGTVDSNVATVSITVQAIPVVEVGSNQTDNEGATVSLAPSTFTDPGGGTHTATIDWGDGATAAGTVDEGGKTISGSHVYADNGVFTVTVTVTGAGGSGSDSFTATILNVAPVVEAGPNQTVDEGDTLSLGSATFTDAGSADTHTSSISWILETGSVNQGAGTVSGSHIYTASGVFTVAVNVTDDDGGVGTDTFTVTVGSTPTPIPGGTRTSLVMLAVALAALLVWGVRRQRLRERELKSMQG